MITLTTEQAQQIEEALVAMCNSLELPEDSVQALATIRAARAQEQNPVAWYDKIKGMEVSVDVSTGEDDDYHRIFGRVDGVMLQSCGAQEDTILVIEDSRNFDAPQPMQEPVAIVDVLALAKELGHPCPEADAAFLEDLAKNIAAPLQAQIDRLMLEYCPVEMTPGQLTEPVNQEPVARPFECWSTNDGDSWFEHPADAQIIEDTLGSDAKVGDEFEVLAGWDSVRVTYRITAKSGNEDLADFEVECISHPHNDAAPVDAKAIRAEALEEAAKVCDAIEEDHWNLYKGRKPYTGSEAGRADPHEQGVSMGAEECAAAIRARGLK